VVKHSREEEVTNTFSQIRIKISASYYTKQPPELGLPPQKKRTLKSCNHTANQLCMDQAIFFAGVKYKMLKYF